METYSSTINFVALLMFFSFLFILFGKWRKSEQKLPPGPWRLPLIGSIHHLRGAFPHRTLRKLARKYGPIMYLQLGKIPAVVISSPIVAKEVFNIHEHAFAVKPQLTSINIITYNGKDIEFAPYGDNWRQMRNLCVTELLSAKMVKSFSSIRNDEILSLVSSVHSMNGSVANITEKILRFTNSVSCRSAFGKVDKYQDKLINLLREVLDSLEGLDVADLFPSWRLLYKMSGVKSRLLKLHQKVDAALENIINEHIMKRALGCKGNGEFGGEDLVDVLLRIKETIPITNDHIKAVISIMAKAQSEVGQVFKGKTTFDEEDLDKLSYLKLVIKETLRLHTPSPFLPRQCTKQAYICRQLKFY
nr:PREDICTED: premnaspirodiene oxygenase-like [Nicotiana sylvestris]